jgi:hypothetical protein
MSPFNHARLWVSGPHLGPLHSVLWSSSPRRTPPRHRAPRAPRRRRWPWVLALLVLVGAVSKAYEAALWAGILVTAVLAGLAALAALGLVARARAQAAAPPPAGTPAGPRDWTPAA